MEELHKKESKIIDKLGYKEQEVSLLVKLGRFEEGEKLYRVLLSMNPDNYRCYIKLYDSPIKSAAEEEDEISKLPHSQKKKLRQKQRKAEARAKKLKFFHKVGSMPAPVTDAEKLIWSVLEAERPTFRFSCTSSILSLSILFIFNAVFYIVCSVSIIFEDEKGK